MKTVVIVGAGWMTKPMVDYFLEKCGYKVIVANRTLSKAQDVIGDGPMGRPLDGRRMNPMSWIGSLVNRTWPSAWFRSQSTSTWPERVCVTASTW